MGLKEFFRPTKFKIYLTLIFFILNVLIASSTRGCACMGPSPDSGGYCHCIPGPNFIYVIAMIYSLIFGILLFTKPIYSFVDRPFHPENISNSLIAVLFFLIILLWNYLIACIIESIYKKFKKFKS